MGAWKRGINYPDMRNAIRFLLLLAAFSCETGSDKSSTVYITPTGRKYHYEGCRYLGDNVTALTTADAVSRNYTPCSICALQDPKPETVPLLPSQEKSIPADGTHETGKKSVSTQCTGLTRQGNRCKRKTRNASGKCYQHQ
jgi:hypothetical protein